MQHVHSHAHHPSGDHTGGHPPPQDQRHHHHHHHQHDHRERGDGSRAAAHAPADPQALTKLAFVATLHCLSGCAIGEVAGMVIGNAAGLGAAQTIALSVALAFTSGFALTAWPLLRAGQSPREAMRTALAADTASITIMELVDNLVMLLIPEAMSAPLDSPYFWTSLAIALALAGLAAWPVNRWLIARGRGHCLAHAGHAH